MSSATRGSAHETSIGVRRSLEDDELVMALIEMALAAPPAERRSRLEQACAADTELLSTIWHYIEAEEAMQGFLLDPLYPPLDTNLQLTPGQLLEGRFRIVREIAQGGMGVVYEAYDEKLRRRIALKSAKSGFRKRLPPEVRLATEISHPNVCKMYEIHTATTDAGDVEFITMEYLEGETLQARLRRGPLTKEEALAVAMQLCAGIAEAHRRQVIHGDLKAGNVMLTGEGAAIHACVTDFGLARGPQDMQVAIRSGTLAGTPDYMAPELWRGAKPSVASDIYALGITLREIAPPRRAWQRVIDRCVSVNPSDRYATADEVAAALAPPSRRWLFGAAAAGVLAVVSGLITYESATAPAQQVRLAVLPFDGASSLASLAASANREAVRQIANLKGNAQTGFSVVTPRSVEEAGGLSPANARQLLGATHVLQGSLLEKDDRITLVAQVTDAVSGVVAREWRASYERAEADYIPAALAGVVTGAFRLPAAPGYSGVRLEARQDYANGLHYLRRNSTVSVALPLLERAVSVDPGSPLTHAALAEGYWWKYQVTNDSSWVERSKQALSAAERRNPDVSEVHRVAGLHMAHRGWYEQAAAEYARAIELDPAHSDGYRRLGMVYDSNNEPQKALVALRKAVDLDPRYHRNHQALANHFWQHGNHGEAVTHLLKTIELAPGEPAGHFGLGTAYMSLGKFAEAEKELRFALSLGETPAALNNLGEVLQYSRRDQEALQYLMRALQYWPERYLLWMNLGTIYRRLNLRGEAERANRKALELTEREVRKNPRDGHPRACAAYLWVCLGDRRRAESEIAQAVALSPNDNDTRRMALLTFEALGRRDDSLAVLANAPPDVRAHAGRHPDLADLARDPRFRSMVAGINGPQ